MDRLCYMVKRQPGYIFSKVITQTFTTAQYLQAVVYQHALLPYPEITVLPQLSRNKWMSYCFSCGNTSTNKLHQLSNIPRGFDKTTNAIEETHTICDQEFKTDWF